MTLALNKFVLPENKTNISEKKIQMNVKRKVEVDPQLSSSKIPNTQKYISLVRMTNATMTMVATKRLNVMSFA